jgi:hypothetical protein
VKVVSFASITVKCCSRRATDVMHPVLAEELLARGEPLADVPILRGLPCRKNRPRHSVVEVNGFDVEVQFPVGVSIMDNFHANDYRKAGRQIRRTVVATIRKAGTVAGTIEMSYNRYGPLLHARPWGSPVGPCSLQLHETLQLFFTDLQNWKDIPDAGEAIAMAYMRAQILRDTRNFPTLPRVRALQHPSAGNNATTTAEPAQPMPKQVLWRSDKPEEKDLPSREVLPPLRLGQAYMPADETVSTQPSEPFAQDPDVVDRGRRGHAKTQNQLAEVVKAKGHEPRLPAAGEPGFDLAWEIGGHIYVTEVKSLTPGNEERQLRLGLGQVLRYRQPLARPGRNVTAVLAVEHKPTDPTWQHLCQELGIILLWPENMATIIQSMVISA